MKFVVLPLIFICSVFVCLTRAHPPWAIVVDERNQIYLSDLETIWKISADAKPFVFRPGVAGRHTHEMRLDSEGNLSGEDLTYEPATRRFVTSLWKMTPGGAFSYVLPPTDAPPRGLTIWRNRAGATFYFGRTEDKSQIPYLLKRAESGAVSTLIGDERATKNERQIILYSLGGMDFGDDGSLFVTDRSTIWRVAPNDKVTVFYKPAGDKDDPHFSDLAAGRENNVFAADFSKRKIWKIAPDGRISVFADTETGWSPSGVDYQGGDLYVLEIKNSPAGSPIVVRARKITADGKASTVAVVGENQAAAAAAASPASKQTDHLPENRSAKYYCAAVIFTITACLLLNRKNAARIENRI